MRLPLKFKEYFWLGCLCFCILMATSGQVAASPGDTRYQKAPAEADLGNDCRAGYVFACVDLGVDYQVSGTALNMNRARSLYHQACLQGDARGCEYERNLRLPVATLPERASSASAAIAPNARSGLIRLKARAVRRGFSAAPKATVVVAKAVIETKLSSTSALPEHRAIDGSKAQPKPQTTHADGLLAPKPVLAKLRDQRPQALKISDHVSAPLVGLQMQERSPAPNQAAVHGPGNLPGTGKDGGGLELSCSRGDSASCIAAGQVYAKSNAQADLPKTLASFQKACELQNSSGCFALGAIYEIGKGVPSNLSQAAHYYDLSCKEGNDLGCRMLRTMPPSSLGSKAVAQIKK